MSSSDVSHVIGGQLSKEWSCVLVVTYCVIGGVFSVDLLRPHHFGGLVTRLMLFIMLFVIGVCCFRLARALSDSMLNWSLPKNIISSGLSWVVVVE